MSDQARAYWRIATSAAYIVMGMFPLLGTLAIVLFALPAVTLNMPWDINIIYPLFGLGMAILLTAALAVLMFVAAWGLAGQKGWGKIVAVIAGIVLLPAFPIGTIVGVLALGFLLFGDRSDRSTPTTHGHGTA
ncbi:MAG: hypothetical protein U0822_17565 [Anaerolineae bacterium]